jgi:hypothetical protein
MTRKGFTTFVGSLHIKALSKLQIKTKWDILNVLVEWETGETTYKPLDLIANDDPVTCAEYARTNG